MLKQLRQKKVMKKVLWGLALVIIPAFVLWGAGGLREKRLYAGTLFGKRISFDEYRESLNAVKNRALLMHGSRFYEIQDKLNLEEEAWDNLIMAKEARRKKIKVSDEEVIARIASFPFFKDAGGAFDKRAYEMILTNSFRTSPRAFEEETRQSLMIEKMIGEAMEGIGEPNDEEIEEALKKESPGDKKEEETPEERRERIKRMLSMTKRFEAYQGWREDLYKRANLVSNIKKEKQEEAEEEIPEE